MAERPVSQLLVQLPLQADESVVSFVQRHCTANYVARMLDMLRLVGEVAGEPVKDVRDIVRSRPALRALETLTGLTPGALDDRFVASVQSTHVRVGHHYWTEGQRRGDGQAVCPACLAETGYARTRWEFVQAPVCLVHQLALLEACPACTKPLRHRRTRLLQCEDCGCDLRSGPRQAVSEAAATVADLLQRPVMVAMGDANSTAPIDQEDLSALLRLCLPGGLGRSGLYGLTAPLASLSVAHRVDALQGLGTAWVDRRIDSERLRRRVLSRWLSAGLLPHKAQLRLLTLAALEVELPGDVLRLLCHGSDEPRVLTAAKQFAGRPPALTSTSAVAGYLGIDEDALDALRGRDGLTTPPEGMGYDMDQVLALQRSLQALLTSQEFDGVAGVGGLAPELSKLHLLEALELADGTLVGIQLDSQQALLSGIQEKVDVRPTARGPGVRPRGVPLATTLARGTDLPGLAWMLAQVRGGSLAVLSWPAPHRLVDLVVDEGRLAKLEAATHRHDA